MPDPADIAQDVIEHSLTNRIENIRRNATPQRKPIGVCYNCQKVFSEDEENIENIKERIFCDEDCAYDFERIEKSNRQKPI